MKNYQMARTYIDQAGDRLETAQKALDRESYPYSVRQSQESVELSLKGALRLYGIEYPREHEVSQILQEVLDKFPSWFSEKIDKFSRISRELAEKRGPSMYGDEERKIPATDLFGEHDSKEALKDAKFVHERCSKLLMDFKKEL